MPMKGITLFIFGGVAEMGEEPPGPREEFTMSIVGPLSSLAIAGIFYGIYIMGGNFLSRAVSGVLGYLAWINALLAAFNLIPAFPLDGGRILRSILWKVKGNLNWATRIASRIGSGFGILLIVVGILNVLGGNFIGGMWWFVIGLFLQGLARASYQRLVTRRALEGESVRRFMKTNPVSVKPDISLQDLLENYVYKYHFKMFPVVEEKNRLEGCITTKDLKEILGLL